MKDYYAILGVNAAAEESLIRAAYKVKTQLYHPQKFSGSPDEAASRMADINEAFAILKDSVKRKAYDAQHGEHDADAQIIDDEGAAANTEIPELPQIRAENFSCPIFVFKPKISLTNAKAMFTEKYVASETRLPDGISIETVVNSTSFVRVPSWLISGSAFGEWRATGINVETQEVICDRCDGKGTIVDEGNEQKCTVCDGTGKIVQHKNRYSTESGTAKALVEEHVQSAFAGIEFNPDFSIAAKPVKAAPDMTADLFCVQPEHDYKKAKEILNERLAFALKNKALSDLGHFDLIDELHFGATEVYLFNKIELWLHPYYVCWYEKRGKKQFAICDGITGKVELPKQTNMWSHFRSLLILLMLGLMMYLGKSLFSENVVVHPKTNPEVATAVITPNTQIAEDKTFQQLPPADEPIYGEDLHEEDRHEENQPAPTKPIKKPAHIAVAKDQPVPAEPIMNPAPVAEVKNLPGKPVKKTKPAYIGEPSFDCNAATIKAEKLICSSRELAKEDRNMAEAFELRKKASLFEIFRKQVEFEQANWIENVRNACADEACLVDAYHKRMGILSQSKQVIKSEICPIPGHC